MLGGVVILLAGLFLPGAFAAGGGSSDVEIDFDPVFTLPVVELTTSQGKLRLVVDTASNYTSLLRAPKSLLVRLAGREILLHPAPIQTREFAGFNTSVPADRRVDGLLGEDFFVQFESVRFDFPRRKIVLTSPPSKDQPRRRHKRKEL
jgi:hypothetical protein